jgi:hypothetical protein
MKPFGPPISVYDLAVSRVAGHAVAALPASNYNNSLKIGDEL